MRSLRVRLLLILVSVVLVALGTMALVVRGATAREFNRYVEGNRVGLRYAFDRVVEVRGGRVVLADEAGHVLVDTRDDWTGSGVERTIVRRQIPDLVEPALPGDPRSPSAMVPALPPEDVLFFQMAPPPEFAGVPGEEFFLRGFTSSVGVAVVAGGLAAILMALLFSRRVLRPIDALTAAARRMEQGDLSQRVPVESRDEIGALASAFNAMADSLSRTERLRRTLVGDVAHELRTPLSNLRGYLEAVRDGVATPSPALMASLHDEALLLSRLVDDLQELTLVEAGQLRLEREPVSLAEALESALVPVAARAAERGLVVHSDLADDLPLLDVDRTRVVQVLRNLLENAIAYTPPGGRVDVSARRESGEIEVAVRDSGTGIAAEHLPHVFERFYRADRSRARATGGAGIGLAIVRELVHAHGGRVKIESVVGKGTTVTFALPAAAGPVLAGAG